MSNTFREAANVLSKLIDDGRYITLHEIPIGVDAALDLAVRYLEAKADQYDIMAQELSSRLKSALADTDDDD
jgi:hypothetical protein